MAYYFDKESWKILICLMIVNICSQASKDGKSCIYIEKIALVEMFF